jgi:hypothetical protein
MMATGKRILVGSALALAASGIVAGAAVSAFANGPNSEWGGRAHPAILASSQVRQTNEGHSAILFPTAVEYASGHSAILFPTAVEYASGHSAILFPTAVEYAAHNSAALASARTTSDVVIDLY